MKNLAVLLLFIGSTINAVAQGTGCSNAIPITLNGSINNYSTSSSTDVNVLCTANGTTPVTWFQFTTNASAHCPLLNITASDGQACEIALYTDCGGNMSNNYEAASSMCFYDGTGLWAPASTLLLTANSTYYLRVKTTTSCTISIGGQHYNPPNDDCAGALDVNSTPRTDNNSCHAPGPGVTFTQLCALSLENTAFYQYYVASTGTSIININNISCDNRASTTPNGFQIGFFTGTCSSLTWLSCDSGSGSFVQATTPILAADTRVYVAVDGNAGSNCKYDIQAINAYTLAGEIKKFSAWKTSEENILKWSCINSETKYFEIERSENGKTFYLFGKMAGNVNVSESYYSFEDKDPFIQSYYRIKVISEDGRINYTKTLHVNREGIQNANLQAYVSSNFLHLKFNSDADKKYEYTIINLYGQRLISGIIYSKKGNNSFEKNISGIPSGKYFIVLNNKNQKISQGFIKARSIF